MIDVAKTDSPAYLRHEYRTPVNHIIGYTDLLIEEAADRGLDALVPVLRHIGERGQQLLGSIGEAFAEPSGTDTGAGQGEFKRNLRAATLEMSDNLKSLTENLESGYRQTAADLNAVSWAIHRLAELGEQDPAMPAEAPGLTADWFCRTVTVPAKRSGGRILIADDDDPSRRLLRRRLECEGHDVTEALNGSEVIDLLQSSPCDLVLLDVIMPVMNGFQTLARIKQDAALRELPVIMISALDEMQSVVRCIEAGAEDYLPKPFNRVLLRARIGASLEKKWLRDRERSKARELEQTLLLLERAQEQLALHASRDALTGLANRRALEAQLELRVRRGAAFSAIYIDLNGFKQINDRYGHAAGDEVLRQAGVRLQAAFRPDDVVGRWGGDEFVVLINACFAEAEAAASGISDRVSGEIAIVHDGGEHRIAIGAAVGVATWKPGETAADTLHRADFAMYEEKLRKAG